jgi:hypothetical protein
MKTASKFEAVLNGTIPRLQIPRFARDDNKTAIRLAKLRAGRYRFSRLR